MEIPRFQKHALSLTISRSSDIGLLCTGTPSHCMGYSLWSTVIPIPTLDILTGLTITLLIQR